MISGRFFLDPDREMPFSKILRSVERLVLAFVVWNVVYHFWYLYMIVGLYLITPFLRRIAEDKQLSEYLSDFSFCLCC